MRGKLDVAKTGQIDEKEYASHLDAGEPDMEMF